MESSTVPTNGINNNKLNRKWKADLAEQDMCQQSFCVYIYGLIHSVFLHSSANWGHKSGTVCHDVIRNHLS